LLRYRGWTLQRLYDQLRLPPRLQTVLAGQAGDYLLPPAEVSLLLHVALVRGYDRGAYYPKKHFRHLVTSIAHYVAAQPGCEIMLNTAIEQIIVERGRVVGVKAADGRVLAAKRYVSNVDPQRTAAMIADTQLPAKYRERVTYPYSSGNLTLYLGVRGIDLREHGFGSWNVWHYPHDDINAIYRRQLVDQDYREPWLFMSTPTLHTDEPGLCPPGDQIIELATSAPYAPWRTLRDTDRRRYNLEKKRIRDRLVQIVEERYVPGLSKHLVMRVMGTPATNARFCGAPEGNAYGVNLTPDHMGPSRIPNETPLSNLWLVNASTGYPSVAGTVRAGIDLHARLQG
jgi:phytoene dehydrogenase-like protein